MKPSPMIQCPKCSADNPPESRFCNSSGISSVHKSHGYFFPLPLRSSQFSAAPPRVAARKGGIMGHRCLMAVVLGIFLSGARLSKTGSAADRTQARRGSGSFRCRVRAQIGMRSHLICLSSKQNGAGVILSIAAAGVLEIPNYYTETVEGLRPARIRSWRR